MDNTRNESNSELVLVGSLREYFRDSLDAAMAGNNVAVSIHTRHYVVNLLALFARSEALHDEAESTAPRKPLALMLADANAAESEEQSRYLLQRMGDISLFTAGFFPEALHATAVGVGYYVRMGRCAYGSLANRLRRSPRGRSFVSVYEELADRYQDIVDVLQEIRERECPASGTGTLQLYESWLTTGSRRAERLLRNQSIDPQYQDWGKYRH